ncbi:MAG: sigma-70 family RNA polymerase sigma factor [Deltaproteobacteria bacterium]|nr:sigma-70 family RNA polymerase sigma factor [Deltaproteobacteria bacterium]
MSSVPASLLTGFTYVMESFMIASPPVKSADEELVALARDGDHKAFEKLVERHNQKAYRIAFGFARDREEAKDLSQDAFLKAFMNLKKFDGRSGFYTWFYRILVNVCLDYKRRRGRRTDEEFNEAVENQLDPNHGIAPTVALDEQVLASELSRKVGVALEALPPKQRTAFILKNHQGLSIKEIAEVMQTAEGTVKVHIHRAISALRQTLAELA